MMPVWLHETLALGGVLIAASWLIVRLVQVGRPRAGGCSRCEHASPPTDALGPTATLARTASPGPRRGVRSEQLRVIS